jgi:hypothetical protein
VQFDRVASPALEQAAQDVAVLNIGLAEIKNLRRNSLILRDAQKHARFAASQRVAVIAERGDVGGEHAHCSRFPPRRPATTASSFTRCSGSRSRPVNLVKIVRSASVRGSPIAAMSSVRHTAQLSSAIT